MHKVRSSIRAILKTRNIAPIDCTHARSPRPTLEEGKDEDEQDGHQLQQPQHGGALLLVRRCRAAATALRLPAALRVPPAMVVPAVRVAVPPL